MIPKLPHHWKMMMNRSIKQFEESVDRTNAKTKCLSLYEASPKFIKELYYTHKFRSDVGRWCWCNQIVGIIPNFEYQWIVILQVLIIAVNVLTCLSFDTENKNRLTNEFRNGALKVSQMGTGAVLKTLGCLIWVLFFILFVLSLVHSLPYSQLMKKKRAEEYEEEKKKLEKKGGLKLHLFKFWNTVKEPLLWLWHWDQICLAYVLFLAFTILGLAHHPFWYCMLLFYFILT